MDTDQGEFHTPSVNEKRIRNILTSTRIDNQDDSQSPEQDTLVQTPGTNQNLTRFLF